MTLEYDTSTRRIKIQVSEMVYRALEIQAEKEGKSISKVAREWFEEAAGPFLKKLTLEDELIVNKRIQKNIEARMEARARK